MPASPRALNAADQSDGVVKLLQPLELNAPAEAVVTVLIPLREPNAVTVAAMQEATDKLPRFGSAAELLEDLEK